MRNTLKENTNVTKRDVTFLTGHEKENHATLLAHSWLCLHVIGLETFDS